MRKITTIFGFLVPLLSLIVAREKSTHCALVGRISMEPARHVDGGAFRCPRGDMTGVTINPAGIGIP